MARYLFLFANTVGDQRACALDIGENDPCDKTYIDEFIRPVLEQDGLEWNGDQFFCVEMLGFMSRGEFYQKVPAVTDNYGDEVFTFSETIA
jgi:hypothetical protein